MISAFMGEFLVNPIPLEMQLHRCNYGCAYCFATLNYRHSQYTTCNPQKIMNQLVAASQRKTLVSKLLDDKYPVLISNHSDPFCSRNYEVLKPILRVMAEMEIPVGIQTKGGCKDDILDIVPPSMWYVTITTDQESIRQKMEPNAPSNAERLALCEELAKRGHVVYIGVNPFVDAWWNDYTQAIDTWKNLGAVGVWTQRLHFHYRQRDNMTKTERTVLGELVPYAMKQKRGVEDLAVFRQFRQACEEGGLDVFSGGMWEPTAYFDHYAKVYQKLFPTMQDFINACAEEERDELDFLTEQDWLDFFVPRLPKGRFTEASSYLGSVNHDLWWTYKVPNRLTFKELLSMIWRNPQTALHPIQNPAFVVPSEIKGKNAIPIVGERGEVFVSYQRHGSPQKYKEFDTEDLALWHVLTHPETWHEHPDLLPVFEEITEFAEGIETGV